MPPLMKPPPADVPDIASDEERMRRALGLTGDRAGRSSPPQTERPQAGPPGRVAGRSSADKLRHRFVQDGAVPVTVLNRHRPDEADAPSASRAAIEAALHGERAARERAERSLHEALATVRDLQTKLGHAELAQREASEVAQAARDAANVLRAAHQEREARWTEDLAAERAARAMAEAALAEAASAGTPAERTRRMASVAAPVAAVQDAAAKPAKPAERLAKRAPKGTRKAASTPRQREPQPVKWWLKSAKWR